MKRISLAARPCSIARTVDLLGDWWTPLILREAFRGVRRFDAFQESVGLGRSILAERLRRLVKEGVLERQRYQERPARYEYRLTEKGLDLFPVLVAMIAWGDRWLDGGAGPPVLLRHRGCGRVTRATVVCAECSEPLSAEDLLLEPGPGARPSPAAVRTRLSGATVS